jgi:hypothetical protein
VPGLRMGVEPVRVWSNPPDGSEKGAQHGLDSVQSLVGDVRGIRLQIKHLGRNVRSAIKLPRL